LNAFDALERVRADVRAFVRRLLDRAGQDVTEAASGIEALRMVHAASIDLVILDGSMPGLDGWGTLARIRTSRQRPSSW
jgi:two-component system response regulator VanR